METQTWFSRHNKFISAENITILSVSSNDFLHDFLEVKEQQMWNYSSYSENKIKRSKYKVKHKNKTKNGNKIQIISFTGEERRGQNIRC